MNIPVNITPKPMYINSIRHNYYGQGGTDSIVSQFFERKNVKNGTFLDVGALDGKRFSNTYLLERAGWKGVCVEMHPSYAFLLRHNRPNSVCYSCGVSDEDKVEKTVSLNWRGSLSTTDLELESHFEEDYELWYGDRSKSQINGFLNGLHKVKLRTLNSIMDDNIESFPHFDFVSIDIDGSEKKALQHCNLDKINPTLLSLEWSVVGEEYIIEYAKQYNMIPARKVGADMLFTRSQEDADIINSLEVMGRQIKCAHPCTYNINNYMVPMFEESVARFFGSRHAVAVDSCTHGLELCLRHQNIEKITIPARTYLSVPFLATKLGLEWEWREENWKDYYQLGGTNIYDSAVLWKKDSYIPGTFMCLSFQFQKHLSLGRGGMILTDDTEAACKLKKMSHDGREPRVPWREQDIDTIGYHYYMTPETAALGLEKLPEAIDTEPRQWVIEDWPDLRNMEIFK